MNRLKIPCLNRNTCSGSENHHGGRDTHRNHSDESAHCKVKACNEVSDACICVNELLRTWSTENDWHDKRQFLRLNKKNCEDLLSHLNRAKESYKCSNKCQLVAREFRAAIQRAKFLVEESSDNKWLLKALELWDCSQHFFEAFVDLLWWAHMMSLGVDNICKQFRCWMEEQEERCSQSHIHQLLQAQRDDREVLGEMVRTTLRDMETRPTTSVVDPEHQLALLLRHRLNDRSMGEPPLLLTSFNFPIRTRLMLPDKSKSGQDGVVFSFPWVYDKLFALKMPRPTNSYIAEDMFKREFDILDKHRSSYIVGVVGYWGHPTSLDSESTTTLCPFLLMEAMKMNFEELICNYKDSCGSPWSRRPTGFSPLETITLMLPVAKALKFLHSRDIAHRDIKPKNIMCSHVTDDLDDIIVKLVDFGEATPGVSSCLPEDLGIAGTNGYMDPAMWTLNPETQRRKKNLLGYDLLKADVFSFAMVFSELLTWRSPWKKFKDKESQDKLCSGDRPPLPKNLPEYVKFIVECCWCTDPTARPAFTDICFMLQNAKMLLRDNNFFGTLTDGLFRYEDLGCVERTIVDRAFLQA